MWTIIRHGYINTATPAGKCKPSAAAPLSCVRVFRENLQDLKIIVATIGKTYTIICEKIGCLKFSIIALLTFEMKQRNSFHNICPMLIIKILLNFILRLVLHIPFVIAKHISYRCLASLLRLPFT